MEKADQVGTALETIARVRPKMLVINGGDGTVQAALTELYNGGHFIDGPPPVAVLPSGKTNLIALDLGARGDPIATLQQLIGLARSDTKKPLTSSAGWVAHQPTTPTLRPAAEATFHTAGTARELPEMGTFAPVFGSTS